jgi:hypothetical protein
MDSIEKLLEDEFNIPVLHEHSGNESITLNPLEDTLIENLSSAQTRNYAVDIIYTVSKAGGFEQVKDHLTNRAERIKRLLFNNSNYSPSGTLKFFNGQVDSITYENDEDEPELWRANISFTCNSLESL